MRRRKALIDLDPKGIVVVKVTEGNGPSARRYLSLRGEDGQIDADITLRHPEELISDIRAALPFLEGDDG